MYIKEVLIILLMSLLLIGCSNSQNTDKASASSFNKEKLESILYSGFKNGPKQDAYEYEISNDWVSIVENHPYYAYDQPHLSWKVAEVLEGLNYAYKATGDEMFLNTALSMYDCLLGKRDDAENRYSWNGEIYSLWGSTSRYNGAKKTLYNKNGVGIANLNFYGTNHDQTTISIDINNDQTFNLTIKHQDDEYCLERLTMDKLSKRLDNEIDWHYYGSPLKNKNVVQAYMDENYKESVPVPLKNSMLENIVVPNTVHTGLILENMAATYVELKKINHPQTKKYKKELKTMIDELIKTTWVRISEDEGFFASPYQSPTYLGGGKILPWNQQFPAVEAIAIYAREEDDDRLKEIVIQFSNHFLKNVKKTNEGYLWHYWEEETGNIDWYESTNYGGIDASSIYTIHKTGIAFSEKDVEMIAKTLAHKIMGDGGEVSSRINGAGMKKENASMLFKYLPYSSYVPALETLLCSEEMNWMQAAKLLHYQQNEKS